MTLVELAQEFCDKTRPDTNMVSADCVLQQLIVATRFYAGYGLIQNISEVAEFDEITPDTEINTSEWAIIRPLFILYVEREQAIQLEASRGLGVDVFGRSVSEINSEIMQIEADVPHRAFCQPIVTV